MLCLKYVCVNPSVYTSTWVMNVNTFDTCGPEYKLFSEVFLNDVIDLYWPQNSQHNLQCQHIKKTLEVLTQ